MFLTEILSIEHLSIAVLVLIFVALSAFLIKLYNREESLPFSTLLHMSFYCKDLTNGDEFFSKKLCRSLGKEKISNLEEFYESFNDDIKSTLVDIFSRIRDSHSYGIEKYGGAYSEPVAFYNKKNDSTKYFICSYSHIVDSSNKNLLKIFIFFHDVTNNMEVVRGIKYENSVLKKDLLYKNNILNALPFPIWVRGDDLKIKYFNTQFNYLISYEQQSTNALTFSRKEDELARKAMESKVMQEEEIYVVINGKRNLYNFCEVPMSGTNLLVGVGLDCEDKDRIRSELQRHIAAQSDLLESTASAVAIYGADTRLKFFNHAFVKMWGVEERWLVTQPTYSEFLIKLREERKLPEQIDFQQFKKEQLDLFTNLTLTQNDFLYLPDGRSLRAIVIPHALGGLLFSYEDMTDRLQLERSYNTLTAVQKGTIDNLNEGITVFSEDGRLQISNRQFAKIWNISEEILRSKLHMVVIIDKIIADVKDVKKNKSFKDDFFLCINSRQKKSLQIEKKDDAVIDILFVPLPDGATLICYRDISDTIMIEKVLVDKNKALQEADKLKTEFLANMSYELRSPLTSIIGFSSLLESKHCGHLNDKQQGYISAINDSSKYLMSLINDILDIASIEAGYMTLDVEKFDFKSAIESVVDLVRKRIDNLDITLKVSFDKIDYSGIGDIKRIKQVIFKLLNNAIGRVRGSGKVDFSIRSFDSKYLIFIIKDNGDYVSIQNQKEIFNKFYGMSNTDGSNNKDNIGMSVVKTIIEMHGGRLTFTSKNKEVNILRAIIPLHNQDLLSDSKDIKHLEKMVD